MTTAKRPSGGSGVDSPKPARKTAKAESRAAAKGADAAEAKVASKATVKSPAKPAAKRPAKAAAGKVSATRSAKPVLSDAVAKPAYSAPALEKGLDVLELLASLSEGVTPSQIAQQLGRSLQEVYRVVVALERRGYIQRPPGEESLVLSSKLHDLSYRYPPMRRLVDAARPVLNRVAIDAYQAFHLAVLDGLSIRVVAQVDSPAPLGFRLRVGTQNPAIRTASGRLLIAYQPPAVQEWLFEAIGQTAPKSEVEWLRRRVEVVRSVGYEMIAGEALKGITDVSFPILDSEGFAPAVITMPFLASSTEKVPLDDANRRLFEAAQTITGLLGGQLAEPKFPLVDTGGPVGSPGR
ncbi:IclR family transcriptional regulator [Kaistia granuli]|uniref:IclR family transcriptional regulator n=1 Tax=Kaistia granuli TaxID=363259 RepID=UPI00036215A9|nr:IclR family transcriptional regulator [Kaistia granuli]